MTHIIAESPNCHIFATKGNLKVNPLDRERAGKLAYLQLDTTGKEKKHSLQNHSQHSCRFIGRSSHHPCDSENQTVLM